MIKKALKKISNFFYGLFISRGEVLNLVDFYNGLCKDYSEMYKSWAETQDIRQDSIDIQRQTIEAQQQTITAMDETIDRLQLNQQTLMKMYKEHWTPKNTIHLKN